MLVPIPLVHTGMGIGMVLLGAPLALGWIPMNRFYGIRTRQAFASPDNWYTLNAYGGRWLVAYGVLLIVFSRWTSGSAPPPTSPWAPLFFVAPLLPIFLVLRLINAHSRRLPDQ